MRLAVSLDVRLAECPTADLVVEAVSHAARASQLALASLPRSSVPLLRILMGGTQHDALTTGRQDGALRHEQASEEHLSKFFSSFLRWT
jgi:hypothetical protein